MPETKNCPTIVLGRIFPLFCPSITPVAHQQRSDDILLPQSEDIILIYRTWKKWECFIIVPIQLYERSVSVQRSTDHYSKDKLMNRQKGRTTFTAPYTSTTHRHNQTHRRERDTKRNRKDNPLLFSPIARLRQSTSMATLPTQRLPPLCLQLHCQLPSLPKASRNPLVPFSKQWQ